MASETSHCYHQNQIFSQESSFCFLNAAFFAAFQKQNHEVSGFLLTLWDYSFNDSINAASLSSI